MSEVDEILDRMEQIPRDQMNEETSGRGTSEYDKFKKVARQVLEPGGDPLKVDKLVERQVSKIRSRVTNLNSDHLSDHQEAKYDVTRSKMATEGGEDITNDEGEQLYAVYLDQKPKKEEPEDGQQDTADEEQRDTDQTSTNALNDSENGESEEQDAASEAEKDFEELF